MFDLILYPFVTNKTKRHKSFTFCAYLHCPKRASAQLTDALSVARDLSMNRAKPNRLRKHPYYALYPDYPS